MDVNMGKYASGNRNQPSFLENLLKWNGQNLLGFALMEVRDRLREDKSEK